MHGLLQNFAQKLKSCKGINLKSTHLSTIDRCAQWNRNSNQKTKTTKKWKKTRKENEMNECWKSQKKKHSKLSAWLNGILFPIQHYRIVQYNFEKNYVEIT